MKPNRSLESFYAGCRFRSRLEARWAYYFDLIGLAWQYEPEAYALPQGNYCPDFLCGGIDPFFIEVKPTFNEFDDVRPKLIGLAHYTKRAVFCVVGPPSLDPQWCAFSDGRQSGMQPGGGGLSHAVFCKYAFMGKGWGVPYYTDDTADWLDETEWLMARNLRFENGVAATTARSRVTAGRRI